MILIKIRKSLIAFAMMISGLAYAQFGTGNEVMIQGFHWDSWRGNWYNTVKNNTSILQNAGIDAIWLPPPSDNTGGVGYIPKAWYNLNNSMGSESQLRDLLADLRSKNIKSIADIVINHRGGQNSSEDFAHPSFNTPNEKWSITREDGGSGNADYDPISAGLKNPGDSGNFAGYGTKDLDHSNVGVRNGVKDWLNWLRNDVGFDGFRYDFVHGFHPKYIKEYNESAKPFFSVGELLEGGRERLTNWLNISRDGSSETNTTLFDFATKAKLQDAFMKNDLSYLKNSNGKAPGLIGTHPKFSCTTLDNHDTGPSPYGQDHWIFPQNHIMKGYAYILTHPGTPMIWWTHYFDFNLKDKINELIKIRKRNQLKNVSELNIVQATQNLYAAIIDNKVALKIGNDSWSPSGSDWKLVANTDGYMIWEREVKDNRPTLSITPKGGNFEIGTVLEVTLKSSNPSAYIYYTLDGTTPTNSSNSAIGSKTLSINSDTKLSAFTQDSNGGSTVLIENYTFKEKVNGITIYFKPPKNPSGNWTSSTIPKIYAWKMVGNNAVKLTSDWSGSSMENAENGWFKYTFENETNINVIFNNGQSGVGTDQTVNLEGITSEKWYDWDKKDFVLSVEDNVSSSTSTVVYPNPTKGKISIQSIENYEKYGVYDMNGSLILKGTILSNSVDVSVLNSGIYYLKLLNVDKKFVIKKIIKL